MKFSQLLDSTPKWQHSDAEVRLKAVHTNELDDANLATLARQDPDTRVRLEATKRMKDETTLSALLDTPEHELPDPAIRACAISRMAELITSHENAIERIAALGKPEILMQIAVEAANINHRLECISRLDNEDSLEQLLQAPNNAKVHQRCAERIHDPVRLERIHKSFQGKNKNVTQTVRSKLKQIKEREAANKSLLDECESICDTLERLANGHPGDDFERQFSYQTQRWTDIYPESGVDSAICDEFELLKTRFKRGKVDCERILNTISAEQQSRVKQATLAVQELESFVTGLKEQPEKLENVESFLANSSHQWPTGFDDDKTLAEQYHQHVTDLEQIKKQYQTWQRNRDRLEQLVASDQCKIDELERLVSRIQWPDMIIEPALLHTARQKIDQMKQALDTDTAQQNARVQKIKEQLDQLEQEIQNGQTRSARKLEASLLKTIDGINIPKKLRDRFGALSLELRELKDWQGFATAQKRQELCVQMERLKDDQTIHPGDKAKAIKELQDQWKALGPSDTKENQKLWTRFKAAGDEAFEPCGKYFAEQRAVREGNLKEREKICESLEAYYEQTDWQNPDWKAVTRVIHEAKEQWHQFRDVPNSARKKIQKRFSRIMGKLENKVEAEEQNNAALKEELILRVKQLLDEDLPVPDLVAETKNIQSQWKSIGITRRAPDQKLWNEFRSQCDLVFARRDEDRNAQQQAENQQLDAARAVIDELKSRLDGNEPVKQDELRQLRSKFKKLKPEKQGTQLDKQFNKLFNEAESRIKQQAHADEMQMISELKRKAAICTKLETRDITPEQADAEWEGNIELDQELTEQLDERRNLAINGDFDSDVLAKNQEAAELICVRIEILADLESPPEARERRMQYQVEWLNRGLSKGERETRSPTEQLRDIQRHWYCLGPVADNQARLNQRFMTAEAILEGKRPD